ncbi:MAG: hypothetical protein WCS51_01705 [Bacilli bacterium]|jgi:hypothetical protein
MQTISRVIVSLVYYNSLVRDTLEYTLPRDKYEVSFYDYKRNGIVNEIKVNSPLKVFIDQNGEKGQALLKECEKFGNDFYSDSSTVIKKTADGLRVDHAQNVKIFEEAIPLHESLNNVIRIHEQYAEKNNLKEEKIVNLLKADERFYRAVSLMTLITEIRNQFEEFNKAMREANGQKTPQSNFIEQDLNKLVGLINLTRQQATCTDDIYTNALDEIFKFIEMMTGKRDLPKGKSFQDVFNEIGIELSVFVEDAEKGWKANYEPCLKELVEDNKKVKEEAEKKVASDATTATPKAEEKK